MHSQAVREAMEKLNPQQLEAVQTLDGPVLVVAGPGTGKTQLLSLRVANILENRDASPENILCLTFTDAGATAMSKRLATFIGKQAYAVRINTFHAFAAFLKDRYIEYFERSPFDSLITDLRSSKLVCELLMELSISDPLYQKPGKQGVPNHISDVKQFIGKIKKSGLTTDELRLIADQSLRTMDYIKDHTDLISSMSATIPTKTQAKADFCDELRVKAGLILNKLPPELMERKVALPGSYEPYGLYLTRCFEEGDWYAGENNNTTGLQNLRKRFFDKKTLDFAATERRRYAKLLSVLNVFDRYQHYLSEHGLFDFDDMILDATRAIEKHTDFQNLLQDQYRYILIDEFQDTNGSQMRIVELLSQGLERPNIMAVGDDDQAIMRFQGASVAFLNQFEETYRGTKRIVLQTNYRSTPSLVQLGQVIARQIEGRSQASKEEKALRAFKKEAAPATFCTKAYATPELQYYAVARSIRQRIDEGFIRDAKDPNEAIAVIASKRKSLVSLIPYLKMSGVDFTYDVLQTVGKIESLQGFFACLNYVSYLSGGDTSRADYWLPQVLAAVELGVSAEEYVAFALEAKDNRGGWTAELRAGRFKATGLRAAEPTGLSKLFGWLTQATRLAAASSAMRALLFLAKPFVDYYRGHAMDSPFSVMEFNYGLSALIDFVEAEMVLSDRFDGAGRPLKLTEICRHLEEAQRLDVDIRVTLPISRPEAVALKTAHGSKGLEYDLVYLIDADEDTWHGRSRQSGISCPNIYLSESRDDDDMRRLLFVAVTRARSELEMSLGKSGTVGELLDSVDQETLEFAPEEIAAQSMALWEDSYYPDDQDIRALVHSTLASRSLSASLLNAFVEFDEERASAGGDGGVGGRAFVLSKAFSFPQMPVSHFEFGTKMHRYLELYLNHVIKTGELSPSELLDKMHQEIDALDFEETEITHMHERLDLIAKAFIPVVGDYLTESSLAEQWIRATVDEVPLVGRSDLLLFSDTNKTIRVCDYKTGTAGKQDDNYVRQLVFYKILIEESGLYPGWTVSSGMDIFVEPDPRTGALEQPVTYIIPDDEVEHVRELIKAVYWRIQNADLDTSAFDPTGIDSNDIQRAFELWLIEDYRQRAW